MRRCHGITWCATVGMAACGTLVCCEGEQQDRTRQDKTRQECAVRRPLENACAGHLVWNCGALICTDV